MKNVLRLPLALLVCCLISACGLTGGNGSADLTPVAQAAPAAKANAFNPWMNKSLPNTQDVILKKYLWDATMIARILRDESYVGTLICHKSERNKINKTFRFTNTRFP